MQIHPSPAAATPIQFISINASPAGVCAPAHVGPPFGGSLVPFRQGRRCAGSPFGNDKGPTRVAPAPHLFPIRRGRTGLYPFRLRSSSSRFLSSASLVLSSGLPVAGFGSLAGGSAFGERCGCTGGGPGAATGRRGSGCLAAGAESGLACGLFAARQALGTELPELPPTTAAGALLAAISGADWRDFRPSKFTFGLLPEIGASSGGTECRDKKRKKEMKAERACEALEQWARKAAI